MKKQNQIKQKNINFKKIITDKLDYRQSILASLARILKMKREVIMFSVKGNKK